MIAVEKIKAAAIIRMSTNKQEDSPKIQRANIIEAFSDEYEIVVWYEDLGKSGSKDKSRRFDHLRMLKDSATSEWKVLLCNNPARFTREDTIEAAADKKVLRDNGIIVISVSEGVMDWTSSTGRIVDAVKAEANHDYSVTLSKNTLDGKIKKARDGKTYGQVTPYGMARQITDQLGNTIEVGRKERYRKAKDSRAIYIPGDPHEVRIVEWIFSEFIRRDVSFHQLAKELNIKGVPSPTGKTWVYQVVHEILKNVRYVGDLGLGSNGSGTFHRIEAGGIAVAQLRKSPMKTSRSLPIHVKNTHEGIIDRKTFDAVQTKLLRRKKTRQHSGREEGFALTGVLFCGHCGKPMYGNERKDPARHRVGVRYSCKGWHRSFESGCGQWMVHQDDVLPVLVEILKEQIDGQALAKAEVKSPPQQVADVEPQKKRLQKMQSELAAGVKRFMGMKEDHPLAGELEAELIEQKAAIEKMTAEINLPTETHQDWLSRAASFWRDVRGRLIQVEDLHFVPGYGRPFQSSSASFGRLKKTRSVSPSSVRELFHSIGCRLTLFFDRGQRANGEPARRWLIVKAHLVTDFSSTEVDRLESLIVWCGAR